MILTDTQDVVNEIFANNPYLLAISLGLIFLAFFALLILSFNALILHFFTVRKRLDYMSTLTDREVRVIAEYLHCKGTFKDIKDFNKRNG